MEPGVPGEERHGRCCGEVMMSPTRSFSRSRPRNVSFAWGFALAVAVLSGCGSDTSGPNTSGKVVIRVATTGDEPDADGYWLFLNGVPVRTVANTDSVVLAPLTSGSNTLELRGVAINCALPGNPVFVEGNKTKVIEVDFNAVCRSRSQALEVRVITNGVEVDPDGYSVLVGSSVRTVGLNSSSVYGNLPPGTVGVSLSGIATNCVLAGGAQRTAEIPLVGTAVVEFALNCAPNVGSVRVNVRTTGADLDPDAYFIFSPRFNRTRVGLNSTTTIPNLRSGGVSIRLGAVAQNCVVSGGDTRIPEVTFSAVVDLTFEVTCTATTGPYYTIAFERHIGNGTPSEPAQAPYICTVRSDGLQQRCLTSQAAYRPAWSPDGKQLIYSQNSDLWAIDFPGEFVSRVTQAATWETDPVFSPDGTRLAYVARSPGEEIRIRNRDGTGDVRLADGYNFRFSPNGSRIVFERFISRPLLFSMAIDGSDVKQLTDSWFNWNPSFTPDGAKIMFGAVRDLGEGIYLMNPDGSGITRFGALGTVRWAYFTPDGKKIVLEKDIDEGTDIFMANPDGSGMVRVTSSTEAKQPAVKP